MINTRVLGLLLLSGFCVWNATKVSAAEVVLDLQKQADMEVSIYNQNLALIRDNREIDLQKGGNEIAFEGVSQQMMPETALISGKDIRVLEQNYEFNLLTPENILQEFVGKEVKTVMLNPENGKNIFDKAVVVNSNYGNPILKFDYGIESNFPGRIVYDKLPENLRNKPTLSVRLVNETSELKTLNLAYLTRGLSWQVNYVAEPKDDDKLSLQGWVTLNNQSGADYKNAKVRLIAGNVNQVSAPRPMVQNNMLMARKTTAMMTDSVSAESAGGVVENLSEYYLFNLPERTDIIDKQSKQISLFEFEDVSFEKKYKMHSQLSVGLGQSGSTFEKASPQMLYKLTNTKDKGMGMPLPAGIVRFYDKNGGNSEFIGSANLPQLAVGEDNSLEIGQAFDIYASGKITKYRKLGEKEAESEVEISFHNAKKESVTVEFEQYFYSSAEIVSENISSVKDTPRQLKWFVEVPAEGEAQLKFKVKLTRN